MSIDFKSLSQSLLSSRFFEKILPGGTQVSNQWRCGDIYGSQGSSFSINTDSGVWKDFSAGGQGGSDIIALYAAQKSISMIAAAKELSEMAGINISDPAPSVKPKAKVAEDLPGFPPEPEGKSVFKHFKHGLPSDVYHYRREDGELLYVVARYDLPDGKQFSPWTWREGQWKPKAWPKPRALFGLELLKPDSYVLLVEGEKAALAARSFLGHIYTVITWSGGAQGWQSTDLSPLLNRRILLWPDADEPGRVAMANIAQYLLKHRTPDSQSLIKVLVVPEDLPKGFDAADREWNYQTWKEWATPIAQEIKPLSSEPVHEIQIMDDIPMTDFNDDPKRSISFIANTMPHSSKKGLKATIENLQHLLSSLNIEVRYNVIKKTEEILIPRSTFSIDNKENASLAKIKSLCGEVALPTRGVDEFITYLADQNLYNPIATWITSKPWDGVSRLKDMFGTVKSSNEELKETLMLRWFISAAAACFNPNGVSAHGLLVFQGAQNLGKTSWFRKLVPAHLEALADGVILKPDDKDSVKQAMSYWLVELGEIDATFNRTDQARIKSFITKDRDKLRAAYAKKESEYARRTVFFGSVNPEEFLRDDTGNRRYWTIACLEIDHKHNVDMQQFWAEIYEEYYQKGVSWFLTASEMDELNIHNESFMTIDPIDERVATAFDWRAPHGWTEQTSTDVLRGLGIERPTQIEKNKATRIIKKLNGNSYRKTNGHYVLRVPMRSNFPVPSYYPPGIVK